MYAIPFNNIQLIIHHSCVCKYICDSFSIIYTTLDW